MMFSDGEPLFGVQVNAMLAAFRGTALLSGGVVSATGMSMDISVATGSVLIAGSAVSVPGGVVTLESGGSFDRYDLISIGATGAVVVTKGTSAMKCPTEGICLLAIVFVCADATTVASMDLTDASVPISRCVPGGTICMWSGGIETIPGGWHLCDGDAGTPDLRDRFVVGAGGSSSPGDVGGEASHTLTIAEMPAHTHDVTPIVAGSQGQITGLKSEYLLQQSDKKTSSTGGGGAHNNLPPYYAIAYIMRLT